MSREVASCVRVTQVHPNETGAVVALDTIDLSIPAGALTVVAGPSGSGKSSLLRLLGCIDRPASGEVWIDGERVDDLDTKRRRLVRRRRLGYLFQRPADNLLPYLSVAEHVELGAKLRRATVDVEALLDVVGLGPRRNHRPAQLSGGEQQRVGVAAAIAGDPALVVADEPTAALDAANAQQLLDLFVVLAARGTTFVVASHDDAAIRLADHVVHLRNGRVDGA
jgi:ABC-type lipoprotein export system ATPase subunit